MSKVVSPDREVRCTLPGEVRAVRSADGKATMLQGFASVYDSRSKPIGGYFVEIVRKGAFGRAIRGEDDVRALYNHDASQVLGRGKAGTLRLFDDPKGLRYEIDLPDTTVARDLAISVDRGDVNQSSFGFRKIKDAWSEERTAEGMIIDIRELLEVELFDISPVTFPAYEDTEVGVRSVTQIRTARERRGKTLYHKQRARLSGIDLTETASAS
ncbi:MAG: HK97 family phage prohead protease [Phycisphaerales bacterium]